MIYIYIERERERAQRMYILSTWFIHPFVYISFIVPVKILLRFTAG